ncbi:MAG: MarR family winged helix-turn-helix transcriptional regulator [Mangrovibacterium sp.]
MKSIGHMMAQTLKVFKNMIAKKLREHTIELSFEQFITLLFISLEETPTQQNIANQLQKDKSIILRHIQVLTQKGYVLKVVNKEDRRVKRLVLTPKGSGMVALLKKIEREVEKQVTAGIPKEDLINFTRVMSKMQANGFEEENSGNEPSK